MLQGENDSVQGENRRFWKGGKERFHRVGKKGTLRVKKNMFEGEKKGSPSDVTMINRQTKNMPQHLIYYRLD